LSEIEKKQAGKEPFLHLRIGLLSHNTTTPLSACGFVLLCVTLAYCLQKFAHFGLVSIFDLSQGKDSSSLLVDDSSETGLALDDSVWHTHLAAESGEEDDKLDRVDIVGNEDEAGLLVLNETDDVVETVLDNVWLLTSILLLLAISDGSGLLSETLLLVVGGLRTVLLEELESLCGGVAVESVGELVKRRGNLEAHVENLALALEANILRPLHHAGEVSLGLDVGTNTEVARAALDERVLHDVSMSR